MDNKKILTLSALGALSLATGCTTTYQVGENFIPPAPTPIVSPVVPVIHTVPVVQTHVVVRPVPVVSQPVIVAPAPVVVAPYRSHPLKRTAGTDLGNTIDGTTQYYREYE